MAAAIRTTTLVLHKRRGVDLCRQRVLAIRRERDVRSPRNGTEEPRRKIERDPQDPEMLLTAGSVGYEFADARSSRD